MTPDIVDIPTKTSKAMYDMIIGIDTMSKMGVVLNFEQKSITLNQISLKIKYLEDPFAEEIINSAVEEGDLLKAEYTLGEKELKITVVKGGVLTMPDGADEAIVSTTKPVKKKKSPKQPSKKKGPSEDDKVKE